MFGLSDTAIIKTLYEKSARHVGTKVFYDPSASVHLSPKVQKLEATPLPCEGLLHQKLLVIDDGLVFLGSANLTRTSLNMHDNLMMGFYSPQVAQFLQEKAPYSTGHLKTMVAGQDLEIWLLPDPRGHALYSIRQMIRNAHKNIKVAMFTFCHPSLVQELLTAHQRGVQVSVIVDYQSGMGASSKAIEELKKEGIPVFFNKGNKLMHHKFMCVDDKDLLLGSANWTKAAFYKNRDLFAILHNLGPEQKQFMQKLWETMKYDSQ